VRTRSGRRTSLSPYVLLPLVAAGLLTWLAGLTDDAWLFLLATAALGLPVAGVAVRPRLDGLTYRVDLPTRTAVGATVTHRFVVHNGGRRISPALRLSHRAPGFDDVTLAVPALRPGGSAEAGLSRVARHRTWAEGHRIVVTGSAPFGLLRVRGTAEHHGLLVVHPALDPQGAEPPTAAEAEAGRPVPARDGTDPGVVREWRPGDSARDVHWRSTARRGRLVIAERERTSAHRCAILLCGPAGAPDFERVVALAATHAVAATRRGEDIALAASRHALGTGSATALLDWCAALRDPGAPDPETLAAVLRWAGRDGQVLLAAPADWRAEWSAAAARHTGGGRLAVLRWPS
jgi:uncharacterized protein (DUF58 family)